MRRVIKLRPKANHEGHWLLRSTQMSDAECALVKSGILISMMSNVMANPKIPSQNDSSRSLSTFIKEICSKIGKALGLSGMEILAKVNSSFYRKVNNESEQPNLI